MVNCTKNPYSLSDGNENKNYLINYISKLEEENLITDKPLLVLNGEAYSYDELKKLDLELYRNDIDSIYAYFKKNDNGAQVIYGENAKQGVVLIKVKKFNIKNP